MKDITDMEKDRQYMKMALELAQKGMGFTAPNPMVGAVIVKRGKVIGQGYHRKYGEPHAEREALASCTQQPEGASIYVTLEPCCHYGKQPPCVNAILESGIRSPGFRKRNPDSERAWDRSNGKRFKRKMLH